MFVKSSVRLRLKTPCVCLLCVYDQKQRGENSTTVTYAQLSQHLLRGFNFKHLYIKFS